MLPKIFAISVITTIIVIGLSVFYYFVIFIPHNEKAKLDFAKQQQLALDNCLQDAENRYQAAWESECKDLDFIKGCRLGKDLTERVDKLKTDIKEDCFRKFQEAKDKKK